MKSTENNLAGRFDEMVDAVLGNGKPEGVRRTVSWRVKSKDIIEKEGVRLDAEHYDPEVAAQLELLHASGRELTPLSEWADLILPGKFARIWAKDSSYGEPYVNATDLMSIAALGKPTVDRYLSRSSDVDIDKLTIHAGTLLLTCSGTLGRVFLVPSRLHGWVATHDLIRVIPKEDKYRGYIHAYLCSKPAQTQMLAHTHGGQIDHITDKQVGSLLVPAMTGRELKWFSEQMNKASKNHDDGLVGLSQVISRVEEKILGK